MTKRIRTEVTEKDAAAMICCNSGIEPLYCCHSRCMAWRWSEIAKDTHDQVRVKSVMDLGLSKTVTRLLNSYGIYTVGDFIDKRVTYEILCNRMPSHRQADTVKRVVNKFAGETVIMHDYSLTGYCGLAGAP
jgi:hypothetical protein